MLWIQADACAIGTLCRFQSMLEEMDIAEVDARLGGFR